MKDMKLNVKYADLIMGDDNDCFSDINFKFNDITVEFLDCPLLFEGIISDTVYGHTEESVTDFNNKIIQLPEILEAEEIVDGLLRTDYLENNLYKPNEIVERRIYLLKEFTPEHLGLLLLDLEAGEFGISAQFNLQSLNKKDIFKLLENIWILSNVLKLQSKDNNLTFVVSKEIFKNMRPVKLN
jgi:hypothetical protein